ncbi:MAG: ATP-binding protein [bacterium]|nr:ATP-binding protein [bacterium]
MTMFDFTVSAVTDLLRICLICRFAGILSGETARNKGRVFWAAACFFAVNMALFWSFHTAWINIACNIIGIGGIAGLYVRSAKTALFATGTICLVSMGCDVAGILLFVRYEDGQGFSQIYEIASVFLFLVCLLAADKIVTARKSAEEPQNASLILIPLCSIALVCVLIYSEACEKTVLIAVSLGLLAINFFMLCLYNQLLCSVSRKYEEEMLKEQIQIYANQLEVIRQSEERGKALRHDLKHHMNELKLLAGRYGAAEILNYIGHMEEFLDNPNELVSSGNAEIDSVLNYMLRKAKEELGTVQVKVLLPERLKYSFDLNVLIGNLLENAIEAARQTEEKYLNVCVRLEKGVLRLQVENSFREGAISKRREGDGGRVFLTTKSGKESHGIGLKNVERIVESRNGSMDIQAKEGIFSVRLLLYMAEFATDCQEGK